MVDNCLTAAAGESGRRFYVGGVIKAQKVPTLIFVAKFREVYFVSSSRSATVRAIVLHVDTETQYSPRAADNLIRDLKETPESGRNALVVARLHELQGNKSSGAANLLRGIVADELAGISAATVSILAQTMHPSAIVRCIIQLANENSSYQGRHICGALRWHDSLALVSMIREGRISLSPYTEFADDTLTLGLLLASHTHLPYSYSTSDLHRSSGSETLFLFGAAQAPDELLSELKRVHIVTWLRLNYDTNLAVWALSNPTLSGGARCYAIAQNAPQVIAGLRHYGVISLSDVGVWLRGGGERDTIERTTAVLNLDNDLVGVKALKKTALILHDNLCEVIPHLSKQSLKSISSVLSDDPLIAEIIESLLPGWHSGVYSLIDTAKTLR